MEQALKFTLHVLSLTVKIIFTLFSRGQNTAEVDYYGGVEFCALHFMSMLWISQS